MAHRHRKAIRRGEQQYTVADVSSGENSALRFDHLRARTTETAVGRPRKDSDMIVLAAEGKEDLKRVRPLRALIIEQDRGARRRKGRPLLRHSHGAQVRHPSGETLKEQHLT